MILGIFIKLSIALLKLMLHVYEYLYYWIFLERIVASLYSKQNAITESINTLNWRLTYLKRKLTFFIFSRS
jgi:hypothetical protein